MRITGALLLSAVLLALTPSPASAESHLMRYADVSQDRVAFTYEGDLWTVPITGGDARRITNDPGMEFAAKFSPDGSMIAFTANYDGGTDVYLMDARGGIPTRLTYHPAGDYVLDWYPDGKWILFRSKRIYPTRADGLYRISIKGGMPERLPVDRAGLTSLSPDASSIAYNRISRESRTWKRHQGGTAQDIWLGNLKTSEFRRLTDWPGTDNFPMWSGDSVYFNSDRENGTLNLYRYDLNDDSTTAMTSNADYDVKYPSLGPGHIVYQYGESLHLLNLENGQTQPLQVNVPSDLVEMRPVYQDATVGAGGFNLSPTGARMVFDSRGEVLNVPVKQGGRPRNITDTSASREKHGSWSPDGKWIAFISDKTGEEEIYLADPSGEKPWRQLTKDGMGWRRRLVWSPDSNWIVFSDKALKLYLVDTDSGDLSVIDQGEYDDGWERWGIQDYVWSPDSKWIAYSKLEESLNQSVFLYSLEDRKIHRVTDWMTQDWSPSFDPDGKYLYFISERTFSPIMGRVDQNHVFLDLARPYLVLLNEETPSPFRIEEAREPIESDEEESDSAEETEEESNGLEIDLQGFDQRTLALKGIPAGNYFRLEAVDGGILYLKKEGHQFLKYQAINDGSSDRVDLYHYKMKQEDPEKRKGEKLLAGINNYHLSSNGEKLVYRSGDTYGVLDVGTKGEVGDGKVGLGNVKVRVTKQQEFLQIFNEAWRTQRDWFYDPGLHGVDWEQIGQKYRKFVPYCGDRDDLNYLMGEMVGELNAGHTYIFGGDVSDNAKRVPTGYLGVDFEPAGNAAFHRIAHIIPGTSWADRERSPLAEPGCPINEGDYLIAIDGETVSGSDNVYRFLENKRGSVVELTYNSEPSADGAKTYDVQTLGSEYAIRYREWVENNRLAVEKATNGTVGYLHIPNMGQSGLVEFGMYWYPQHMKQAMIFDVRYNGGGFTGDMIIDRIEREIWAITQPREGKPIRDPERCFRGHVAVLINEETGSNGEHFSEALKLRGLAKIIGMRTWGGAVGIEAHQDLVDGGATTPPQFAPYGLNRNWLIEGRGVEPDVEVPNLPADVLAGKDPQLDAGIGYLMKKLSEQPMDLPEKPDYPDKSK